MSKKRIFLFFAICIFYGVPAFSEKPIHPSDPEDSSAIYFRSLKLHLAYLEKSMTNQPLPQGGYWHVNMEIPDQLAGRLPDQIGHFRISYMDKKEIRASIKKHRSIDLIRLFPAVVEDNLHVVGIVNFIMTYHKRKLNYGNSGGSTVKFRYDNSQDGFVVVDVKQGSI
jgi:hypothetical protein